MKSSNDERSPDETMKLLERRAEVVRSRLLRTIDSLDARRHQVIDFGHEAKRLAVPVLGTMIGVAAFAGGAVVALGFAFKRRRARRLGTRLADLRTALLAPPRPSFARELARKTATAVITMALTELARRGTRSGLGMLDRPQLPR